MTKNEMIEFIKAEKTEATKALTFRNQSEECWRGGTDQSWKEVGCRMTKKQRVETSQRHARIAVKCQKRIDMLNAILNELSNHSPL